MAITPARLGAYALFAFIPISLLLAFGLHATGGLVFVTGILAIVPTAELIRRSTEHIAARAGSSVGGILNVTMGNLPELVIGLFLIAGGHQEVVHGQITGTILGNGLLGLGLGIVAGGVTREKQTFRRERAGLLSSLLVLSVIGLLVPSIFDYTERGSFRNVNPVPLDEPLSRGVAIVLIAVYVAALIYTFVTHRNLFASHREPPPPDSWPLPKAIAILVMASAIIAVEAALVSSTIESAASQFHLSQFFLGVTVLAVVGNASEYLSAIYFARQDRMGLVMSITLGSSIQMALLIAPLLVLSSFAFGHPITLVFKSPLILISIGSAAFAVNTIAQDGETNWFEGVLLLGIYVILAMAFYYVGPA